MFRINHTAFYKVAVFIGFMHVLGLDKKQLSKKLAFVIDCEEKTEDDKLESQKEELEGKIALEKARQTEPLSLETVKALLYYFAHKKYETDEARNEFFNSFVNRVILYDDRVLIFYNTDKQSDDHLNRREYRDNRVFQSKQRKRKLA